MAVEDREFYMAALTAGSILSGFIGTFLNFRIQREANYYRQPVPDFDSEQARDVFINRSRFPLSLVLILLGAVCSITCGVFLPLAALARWVQLTVTPASILAGLVAATILVAAYFFAEMFHYGMLRINRPEWSREGWIAAGAIPLAAVLAAITYFAARR